jgi:hypothetical protein
MAWWVTVEETQSGETLLQRQLTKAEMNESPEGQPLRIAEEALETGVLDPEEASDFPHLAPYVVTYYRRKKDIHSAVCWSSHGFYPAR